MKLKSHQKENFETLGRAFKTGDVALMVCKLKKTIEAGDGVPVICAVGESTDGQVEMIPFAILFHDNPYELVEPMEGGNDGEVDEG